MYQELTQGSAFSLDCDNKYFISNTGYLITGNNLSYLIKLLNSKIVEYAYKCFYGTLLGDKGLRWLSQHIVKLPIPLYEDTTMQKQIINSNDSNIIEMYICKLYGLNVKEIEYIVNRED